MNAVSEALAALANVAAFLRPVLNGLGANLLDIAANKSEPARSAVLYTFAFIALLWVAAKIIKKVK